ncbi:MAG: hypothetical protein HC842_00450 [Cytophagales bacterium]|nr:hypothetical protein [Cytophagales bacterium]
MGAQGFFPTRSDSSMSLDSVVYYLSTFELDPVQYLGLPIYLMQGADSTAIYADSVPIFLRPLITEIPDSLDLRANTRFWKVPLATNYVKIGLVAGGVLVLLVVAGLLFGSKLIAEINILRLQRAYRRFVKQFEPLVVDDSRCAEAVAIWKSYLEKLERRPLRKMTTKEIDAYYGQTELKTHLRQLDKKIYGAGSDPAQPHLQALARFAEDQFQTKVEHLRYAKPRT